jgi:hypothetical protein
VIVSLLFIALAVVTFRASPFNRPDSTAPTQAQTATVGDPSMLDFEEERPAEPTNAAGDLPAENDGTLRIVTKDRQGRPAPQIPVVMKGPLTKNLTTDSKGVVTLKAPPGIYEFAVPIGCQGPLRIAYGATASRQLLAGTPLEVALETEWLHRIAPAGSADSSHTPDWPVGKVVQVFFDVHDRCEEVLAPPGSTFPTWRFRASANLEIVALPQLTANEHSKSQMEVRCLSGGVPELIAYDSTNPSDTLDLVQVLIPSFANRRTECRS